MSQILNIVKEADSGASVEWNLGWNDIICRDGNEEEKHFTPKKTKKMEPSRRCVTFCVTACVCKQECTSLVTTTRPCTESTFSEKWLIVLFLHKTRTDDSSVSVGDASYLSSLLVSESTFVSLHVLSNIPSPSPPGNGPSNATVVPACRWVGGGGGLCTCGGGVLGVWAVSCSHCTEI